MKAVYLWISILLFAATGCADENYDYGDKGAPKVEYAIDPVSMVRLDVVTVGQNVQFVGDNFASVHKISINDVEVAIGSTTRLTNSLYLAIPRLTRSESYVMTLENDFGTTEVSLSIGFPPFEITGIFNEWTPPGKEIKLLGESMDLYARVGVSKLMFGDKAALVTEVSETWVKAVVPEGVGNKTVITFLADDASEGVKCPVRYRDDTFIIENLEDKSTTRYPDWVVPNDDYPAPLDPAPTEGSQYTRIVTEVGKTGLVNMIGNYNLVIPESYFTTDADNYVLKFELCTLKPIAYRVAIALNQSTNWYAFGPSSLTTDPSKMISTDGEWQTFTIPMDTWKNKGGTKNMRMWVGSHPSGNSYDFCIDNVRLQPINWE